MTFEDQEMAGSTTAMTKQKEKLLSSSNTPSKSDEIVNQPIDFQEIEEQEIEEDIDIEVLDETQRSPELTEGP